VARVVEQHEREQTVDLGFVHQGGQLPGESDRLGREGDVADVAAAFQQRLSKES
jgi:hypothetical protein